MDEPIPSADASRMRRRAVSRLVVELNQHTAQLLEDLVRIESMNKTTLVNRAVQVYSLIAQVQREGGKVYIQEAGTDQIQRLRVI